MIDLQVLQGRDTWGGYKLTLIDSMDTLLITGDLLQFRRLDEIVRQMSFDIDKNVSVFETNIRIVGGLISSHLLYRKVLHCISEVFYIQLFPRQVCPYLKAGLVRVQCSIWP